MTKERSIEILRGMMDRYPEGVIEIPVMTKEIFEQVKADAVAAGLDGGRLRWYYDDPATLGPCISIEASE